MKSANPEHWDFYKKVRRRMQEINAGNSPKNSAVSELLLAAPDLLHLCLQLVKDPDVPARHKIKLGLTIAYLLSPIDLIPAIIFGPLGALDDIAVAAYALNSMLNDVPEHVMERHWAGNKNLIALIRAVVKAADGVLGKGLFSRFARLFGKKDASPRITGSTS
jgi:uncharacterized membrane protein YkvA (DUF1232 family)